MDKYADNVDAANDLAMIEASTQEQIIRRIAASMPDGEPGECVECGGENPRLVNGVCSPCRDFRSKYRIA